MLIFFLNYANFLIHPFHTPAAVALLVCMRTYGTETPTLFPRSSAADANFWL